MEDDANPEYGMSPDDTATRIAELRKLANILGRKAVADEVRISRGRLTSILAGGALPTGMTTAMARLRIAANVARQGHERKLSELRKSVKNLGLER
ncbi:hypothetical protein [Asticcacaulis sp. YBE204]|uniref:hypothetical protein n=1 Tax=Asticcacaulis sp. YBE204 TaxID=1282363 RepID=UPI0012DE43DC|nr:hypothetical protein [Asticcacaulis sp. YBE204]